MSDALCMSHSHLTLTMRVFDPNLEDPSRCEGMLANCQRSLSATTHRNNIYVKARVLIQFRYLCSPACAGLPLRKGSHPGVGPSMFEHQDCEAIWRTRTGSPVSTLV